MNQQKDFISIVLEALPHPFYVIDAKNHKVIIANSAANLFGHIKGGITCYELTHKRDKPCSPECICLLEEVKKTKKPAMAEHIHYDKNGKPRVFEVRGYPMFDKDGNVIQMIEYSLDITERKEMENALRKALDEWSRTFNSISDLVFITDCDHKISKANMAFAESFNLRPEELVGKKCYEVFNNSNEPCPKCPLEMSKKDKLPHIEEMNYANIGIPLLVTVSPIFDEKGEIVGAVHFSKDISKIRKLENKLRERGGTKNG